MFSLVILHILQLLDTFCDMKQMTMKNSIRDVICQLLQNLIKCIVPGVK